MTYNSGTNITGNTTISSLFDSRTEAERAVERLHGVGIAVSQIRVEGGSETMTADADAGQGFWDKLGDYFFPDEDRYSYAEGLSRGGYLVTVTGLTDAEYDAALAILDDAGTVNMDEREESWRSEGWGGYASGAHAATGGTSATTPVADRLSDDAPIPVVEERLRVGKRDTSRGHVRVRAYTVEEPVSESVQLREEHVELERRPVDRPAIVDEDYRERTIEAEAYREEAVVSKEARVVEEIGLRRTSDSHRETISDTVRHTEVEIEDDREGRGLPKKPL